MSLNISMASEKASVNVNTKIDAALSDYELPAFDLRKTLVSVATCAKKDRKADVATLSETYLKAFAKVSKKPESDLIAEAVAAGIIVTKENPLDQVHPGQGRLDAEQYQLYIMRNLDTELSDAEREDARIKLITCYMDSVYLSIRSAHATALQSGSFDFEDLKSIAKIAYIKHIQSPKSCLTPLLQGQNMYNRAIMQGTSAIKDSLTKTDGLFDHCGMSHRTQLAICMLNQAREKREAPDYNEISRKSQLTVSTVKQLDQTNAPLVHQMSLEEMTSSNDTSNADTRTSSSIAIQFGEGKGLDDTATNHEFMDTVMSIAKKYLSKEQVQVFMAKAGLGEWADVNPSSKAIARRLGLAETEVNKLYTEAQKTLQKGLLLKYKEEDLLAV